MAMQSGKRKTRSIRRKGTSTPGQRLLNKIQAYTVFPLSFQMPPVHRFADDDGNFVDMNDEAAIEEWYFNRNQNRGKLSDQVRSICTKSSFKLMSSERTVSTICRDAYILFNNPSVFIEVPTVATFERDITTFREISEKHRGLITDALKLLSEKYNGLEYLSDDYIGWKDWLADEDVGLPDTLLDPSCSYNPEEQQAQAIKYADAVLRAIPPDIKLSTGRGRLIGMRWFISRVASEWKCCAIRAHQDDNIAKDPALFYAFLIQLINSIFELVPRKKQALIRRVVKSDDNSIKDIARIVLHDRDIDKSWEGRPKRTLYFIGSGYGKGLIPWARITIRRLGLILSLKLELYFFQSGYLKARLRRKIRNLKKEINSKDLANKTKAFFLA